MARLSIDQLKCGMVLGEDLRDCNGRFLLSQGVELTEKHLRILKIWGVTDAEIEGVSTKDIETANESRFDPQVLRNAFETTKARFLHADFKHEATREMFRLCTIRCAGEIQTTGRSPYEENGEAGTEAKTPEPTEEPMPHEPLPHINPYKLILDEVKLPSLPTIFDQIQDVIHNPRSSARNIAEVISKDTGLSARLLKLVNSAFYGYPSKIDSLSRAVTIIGTKQLSSLAVGIIIMSVFKNIPEDLIHLKSFWKHSVACGLVARVLARYKNVSNSERIFVEGLLHDVGRMILYGYLAPHARKSLVRSHEDRGLLHRMEREVMGCNHTHIGAVLLKTWKLPVTLEHAIRYHHSPARSQYPLDSALVHLADILVNALGLGSSGERFVPPLDPSAWDYLGLPVSVFGPTINQVDHQINEITQFFFANG